MASHSRLAFIDLLRGLALLVMIEVHVFNAFIIPEFKATTWYHALNFINGLVAPSFIFISGFVFLLASQKKLESFRTYGSAFWKQIGRIGLIWIVGYCLHLPFFSFHRTITEATENQWLSFYQSDVLHCIAFGLLALFLSRLLIRNDRTYRTFLFLSGLLVVATTMFIWDVDFNTWIPAPLAAYFNGKHYSLFPLFPWMAFMLFGGYFASGYIRARGQQKEKDFILRFALTGAILFAVCVVGRELPVNLHIGSNDIRANPVFFLERLGIVMLLLTTCWFYADYRKTEKTFVLDIARESLMVYAVHLLVIYGQFFNERSLSFYYSKTFGVLECIAGTFVLLVVMIGAAMTWGWLKRNHLPLARVFFWMFTITTTVWYFMH
jgi:uncharacterized membrane protein/predicted membrane protein